MCQRPQLLQELVRKYRLRERRDGCCHDFFKRLSGQVAVRQAFLAESINRRNPWQLLDLNLLFKVQKQQRTTTAEGAVNGGIQLAQNRIVNPACANSRSDLRQDARKRFSRGDESLIDQGGHRVIQASRHFTQNGVWNGCSSRDAGTQGFFGTNGFSQRNQAVQSVVLGKRVQAPDHDVRDVMEARAADVCHLALPLRQAQGGIGSAPGFTISLQNQTDLSDVATRERLRVLGASGQQVP